MVQHVDCIELMTVDGRSNGQPPVYVSSVLVPLSVITADLPIDRFCDWDDFVDAFEGNNYHRMCVAGSVLAQLGADPRCKAIRMTDDANKCAIPSGYTISQRHLRLLLDD